MREREGDGRLVSRPSGRDPHGRQAVILTAVRPGQLRGGAARFRNPRILVRNWGRGESTPRPAPLPPRKAACAYREGQCKRGEGGAGPTPRSGAARRARHEPAPPGRSPVIPRARHTAARRDAGHFLATHLRSKCSTRQRPLRYSASTGGGEEESRRRTTAVRPAELAVRFPKGTAVAVSARSGGPCSRCLGESV